MTTNTLYTLGESTMIFDPTVPCMIACHVGFKTTEESNEFLIKGLELLIERKKAFGKIQWVADLRLSDALSEEAAAWAADVWNFSAIEAGITHMAVIVSEDEYGLSNMSAELYVEGSNSNNDVKQQMTTRIFKDEETAKSWLREELEKA